MVNFTGNESIYDKSFTSIKIDFEKHNEWTDQKYGYRWIDKDTVEFYNNYLAAPRIAYWIVDNHFMFTFLRIDTARYYRECFGKDIEIIDPETLSKPICDFKQSIREDYLLKDVNFIENWSKVILHRDGTFEVTENTIVPYSLDLRENKHVLKAWILKYKKMIDKMMSRNRFRPTITGGLDSRCMAGFYRYNLKDHPIEYYYLKAVKPDGKNEVELGHADRAQAAIIANKLGIPKITESLNFYYSISAIMNENGREFYGTTINDPSFVYKFIEHAKQDTVPNMRGIIKCSTDDLYLQLKHPNKDVMRCILALLMAEDLMDIPLIGAKATFEKYNHKPYSFYEEYAEPIKEAKEILAYWGEDFKKEIDDILHGKY